MTRSYFMARGRMLRIHGGADRVLQVQSGALWVTQEGDHRDYYLAPGSRLRVSGDGLVLAHAMRQTTVTLSGPQPRAAEKGLWSSLCAPHARPTTVSL